jgi:hypothetical protein
MVHVETSVSGDIFIVYTQFILGKFPEFELVDWAKQFIHEDQIFIDIGAGEGYFTIPIARIAQHVYAFSNADNLLCKSVALNNLDNVTIRKMQTGVNAFKIYGLPGLIRVNLGGQEVQFLKQAELRKLLFPTILCACVCTSSKFNFLRNIGYNIFPVVGYGFLASHKLRNQRLLCF